MTDRRGTSYIELLVNLDRKMARLQVALGLTNAEREELMMLMVKHSQETALPLLRCYQIAAEAIGWFHLRPESPMAYMEGLRYYFSLEPDQAATMRHAMRYFPEWTKWTR